MFGLKPRTRLAVSGLALIGLSAAGQLALAVPGHATAGGTVVVKSAHDPVHGNIVVDAKGFSVYLLTSEAPGRFSCTLACSVFWPPLTVPAGTTQVSAGPGVLGKLGLVKNPEGSMQVTYNGYPLYHYLSDHSPGQTQGEGITSFGGTWYLVNPAAITRAHTAVH